MVPTPISNPHSSRLFVLLYHLGSRHVSSYFNPDRGPLGSEYSYGMNGRVYLAKRAESEPHDTKFIVFAVLIPILVILSGVFAGLTLGYMSLDETQLNVLSISGTPKQQLYANKIKPIRKNGHLLLVTLLLANMIVNESLPVISDPVLGGGIQSVVVSTVLIVIFAEIIPQSLCTRHGLYLGAKMAKPTQFLIYGLGIISWPVAKLLEFVLGPHHGIIYRRAELKELIAMHSSLSSHGGDLKNDTVAIIGATLDLQEKVVSQAMTPISDVFMLSIESKLDYELLKKICLTGHSRVPVYEEVDVPVPGKSGKVTKAKKIVGILLVKQCVLLDPKDAVPLRKLPLNKVPFVPNNMSLLGILDRFQEGRSHMAIVSRLSVEKAQSVKKVAKRGLTQRLRERVGMGDSSSSGDSSESEDESESEDGGKKKWGRRRKSKEKVKEDEKKSSEEDCPPSLTTDDMDGEATLRGEPTAGGTISEKDFAAASEARSGRSKVKGNRQGSADLEMGVVTDKTKRRSSFRQGGTVGFGSGLEQMMPADAVLGKEGAEDFLQGIDPAVMPLGIITLEDVLEELIGEEIYDEFDPEGGQASYVPAEVHHKEGGLHLPPSILRKKASAPQLSASVSGSGTTHTDKESTGTGGTKSLTTTPVLRPIAMKGLSFITNRSRSAPPTPRDQTPPPLGTTSSPPRVSSPPISHAELSPLTPPLEDGSEGGDHGQLPTITLEEVVDSPPGMYATLEGYDVGGNENANIGSGNTKSKSLPPAGNVGPVSALSSAAVSRSASPAPSLEAVLLDRKRRLAAGAGPSSSAPPPLPAQKPSGAAAPEQQRPANAPRAGSNIKGRFKSSPLGGGERSGVVVAEKVKEDLRSLGIAVPEDVPLPDDMDKAGPDKKENTGEGA